MANVDTGRLGLFFGTLVTLVVAFHVLAWGTDTEISSLAPAYMVTPAVSALPVVYRTECTFSDLRLRVGRVRWLAAAVLAGAGLVVGSLVVSLGVPGVAFDPSGQGQLPSGVAGFVAALGVTVVAGGLLNSVMGFGEELGWRGYLLWELAPLGFWRASVVIGVVWGLWHFPTVLAGTHYQGFPYVGMGLMVAATVGLSPVYTYLVVRADSVLAAAVLHGVFNGSAITVQAYTATETIALRELVARPIGVAGLVACAVAAAVIALRGTPAVSRPALATEQ